MLKSLYPQGLLVRLLLLAAILPWASMEIRFNGQLPPSQMELHSILSRMRGIEQREVKKFYLNEKVPAGWCATRMKNKNLTIGLSWPIDQVPYLAILPNEGGWDDACCLYFEPSTCTFDRPDLGRKRNQVATISGFATHHWYINLTITESMQFHSISPDGLFN